MKRQMQVYAGSKRAVEDVKKELNLKNESEAIAYLYAIREIYKDKITFTQHNEAMEKVKELHNQQTM